MVLSQNMRRSNFYLQDSRLWFEGHLQHNYENESGNECERWVSSASVEEVTRVSRTAAAGQEQKPTFKWEGIVFLLQSTPHHTVFPHFFSRCGLKIYVKLCKWALWFPYSEGKSERVDLHTRWRYKGKIHISVVERGTHHKISNGPSAEVAWTAFPKDFMILEVLFDTWVSVFQSIIIVVIFTVNLWIIFIMSLCFRSSKGDLVIVFKIKCTFSVLIMAAICQCPQKLRSA